MSTNIDWDQIYGELKEVLGGKKVSRRVADIVSYSHDFWPLLLIKLLKGGLRGLPNVIVFPENSEDVAKVVDIAYRYGIPIYPYGGGTGVVGGAVPKLGGIVVDVKGIRGINLDKENLIVEVGAGVIGKTLEDYLNRKGFTLGHFPQSFYASTVGGWIGTKAVGQFSTRYGGIEDMLLGMEVVVPPGEILDIKPYPRSAVGPDIKSIFVEGEGAFGIVTKAYLKVWPYPEKRVYLSFGSNSLEDALNAVKELIWRGARPAVIRIYDEVESKKWFYMVSKRGWRVGTIILIEGDPHLVDAEEKIVKEAFKDSKFLGSKPVEYWLEKRFDVKELSEFLPLGVVIDTIEVSIDWRRASSLYYEVIKAIRSIPGTIVAYAHASHFYPQGVCFYFIFGGAPEDGVSFEEYYMEVWDSVMRVTNRMGGAISHHHGVGRLRARWITESMGQELYEFLKKIKRGIDNKNIMNRGSPWGD